MMRWIFRQVLTEHETHRKRDFSFQSEKRNRQLFFFFLFHHSSVILCIYRWKQYWLKTVRSHRAPRWFGFIQSWPWLLDWTHWLKGNFNDLLSQVLIRCWQTALRGAGQGRGPERTKLAGLPPLGRVKGWAAHMAKTHRSTSFPLEHSLCAALTSSSLCPGRPWLRCFGAFFKRAHSRPLYLP